MLHKYLKLGNKFLQYVYVVEKMSKYFCIKHENHTHFLQEKIMQN